MDENHKRRSLYGLSEERAECEVFLQSDEITIAKHADTFKASDSRQSISGSFLLGNCYNSCFFIAKLPGCILALQFQKKLRFFRFRVKRHRSQLKRKPTFSFIIAHLSLRSCLCSSSSISGSFYLKVIFLSAYTMVFSCSCFSLV